MKEMTLFVKTSFAFDSEGNRDPNRDDWEADSVHLPDDFDVNQFVQKRHPTNLGFISMESSKALELGYIVRL